MAGKFKTGDWVVNIEDSNLVGRIASTTLGAYHLDWCGDLDHQAPEYSAVFVDKYYKLDTEAMIRFQFNEDLKELLS